MSLIVIEDGWIRVPYDGADLSVVEMALGDQPTTWQPAFLHTTDWGRVAQIRPPAIALDQVRVWLRVNGMAILIGRIGDGAADPVQRSRRRRS
jgi:hypothetical protein